MKRIKVLIVIALFGITTACKDQLDVKNPNQPDTSAITSESGIVKFALGATYTNGFRNLKWTDGVVGLFWGNGYHDLMADVVGAEAANIYMNQVGAPLKVTLDDATVVNNPNSPTNQIDLLRAVNLNAKGSDNPVYGEWAYMYSMNNVQNIILSVVDNIDFSGDADTKRDLIKAWAHFWKGFAYLNIGSFYIAGVINDSPNATNNNYVANTDILAEAENQFAQAEALFNGLTANDDYENTLSSMIPDFCQTGKGGVLSPAEWKATINTLRARSILANTRVSDMTATQWNQILTLTASGIASDNLVLTGRSNATGDFLAATSGTIAAKSTGDPGSAATYKISERLIQDFQPGDDRLTNNFTQLGSPWLGNVDRGNVFNTRWQLEDGGTGMDGVIVYSNKTPGENEIYLAGSYEENALMRAEALIKTGSVDAGVALINDVRTYQGSNISSPTGLTASDAEKQLRSERRVALLFRRLAFYDARRWGVIDPIADGGGRTACNVVDNSGTLNTNATIEYNYMDYWDVPDNDIVYNAPAAGSAPTKNPKYD